MTEQHWYCPECSATDVTHQVQPHTRFHACRALNGLTAPMVPDGTRARLIVNVREDYVGNELVQTDGEGTPIMSVNVVRDDGMDCVVYAPTAVSQAEAKDTA